jgi:hypothetical protein
MAKTSHQSGAAQLGAATSRRSFLRTGLAVGAGTVGAGLLANGSLAVARASSSSITTGDVDILRFLAAIEIIESDLWEQYNELGGIQDSEVPGEVETGSTPPRCKSSMGTCLSISTTTPMTSSAT